ncbi:MAG: thiopeptide-type bacteriocin biosynthesis protein [Leifsonia sp.]
MTDPKWTGFHLYLFREQAEVEELLVERVAPFLDGRQADGTIQSWYFLRYWTGGPHLRFRVSGADGAGVARIGQYLEEAAIRENAADEIDAESYFAAFGDAGVGASLERDGALVIAQYEAEIERYGGSAAISIAESLFVRSSELARAVIAGTLGHPERRLAITADLLLVFGQAMEWTEAEVVRQLRSYFFGWDASTESTPIRARWLVTEARRAFRQSPGYWMQRWEVTREQLSRNSDNAYTIWGREIAGYRRELAALGVDGPAIHRAAWSQMHMLMNRLGVSVADERKLCWLIGLGIESRQGNGQGAAGADLRYLLSSRYQATSATDPGANGSVTPVIRRPHRHVLASRRADNQAISALRARRSRTSGFTSTLTADDVAALLCALPSPPGRVYPSPGALYPTQIHVYCRAIDGIPDAVYRYQPEADELVATSSLLDDEDLEAASPYLKSDGDSIATAGAQLIVLLVTDLTRLRSKYGDLSLKLAWLEVGHVSQALITIATSMGLATLPVAGMDDDVLNAALHLDGQELFVSQVLVIGGTQQ